MAIATTAMKNILATAYGGAATHAALFVSDPGTTGSAAGEVTGGSYARKPITWSAPSNGTITATVVFDVPAGASLAYSGQMGGPTGANLLDRAPVVPDPENEPQVFVTAGTYTLALSYTQQ